MKVNGDKYISRTKISQNGCKVTAHNLVSKPQHKSLGCAYISTNSIYRKSNLVHPRATTTKNFKVFIFLLAIPSFLLTTSDFYQSFHLYLLDYPSVCIASLL